MVLERGRGDRRELGAVLVTTGPWAGFVDLPLTPRPHGAGSILRGGRELGTVSVGGDMPSHEARLVHHRVAAADDPPGPEPEGSALRIEERAAAWLALPDAMARWAGGTMAVTPAMSAALRYLEVVSGPAPPAGAYEVSPQLFALPVRTPTLPPATHTNAYLVRGKEGSLLVEPASPFPDEVGRLAQILEAEGDALRALLVTHHHADHVGGAAALRSRVGVPLWAHRDTAARLDPDVPVDRWLEDGERLELGGRSLEVLHTPGHAPGHICLLDDRSGAAMVGDLVAGVGTILIDPDDDGDMAAYLASLRRLAARGPRLLLPAHGPPVPDAVGRLERYVRHRLDREAKVVRALTQHGGPARAADLVPVAYDDAPRAVWPLAARSIEAHLGKLSQEGRITGTDEGWLPLP